MARSLKSALSTILGLYLALPPSAVLAANECHGDTCFEGTTAAFGTSNTPTPTPSPTSSPATTSSSGGGNGGKQILSLVAGLLAGLGSNGASSGLFGGNSLGGGSLAGLGGNSGSLGANSLGNNSLTGFGSSSGGFGGFGNGSGGGNCANGSCASGGFEGGGFGSNPGTSGGNCANGTCGLSTGSQEGSAQPSGGGQGSASGLIHPTGETPYEIRKETTSANKKSPGTTESKPPESQNPQQPKQEQPNPQQTPEENKPQAEQPKQPEAQANDTRVVVISDPSTCPGCVKMENNLTAAGIPHETLSPDQAGYHGMIPHAYIMDSNNNVLHDFGVGPQSATTVQTQLDAANAIANGGGSGTK